VVIFAAQGDPRRAMALLWRSRASHAGESASPAGAGAPGSLDVDAIVRAGMAVADAEGFAGLSMRAVGERLGRTAMALYTHVPGKSTLVDLMVDAALAELPTSYDGVAGWREAVSRWCSDLWDFYLRHPWVLQVSQARPALGPNEFAMLETVVGILHRSGLDPTTQKRVAGGLVQLVRGIAQTAAEARQAPMTTGVSDEEWWYARSAVLAEVAPDLADRFPAITQLEEAGAYLPEDDDVPYLEREARQTFDATLQVFLDGVEVAAARRRSEADGRRRPAGA
jgi:AcrR family transcriptional regulator